MYNTVSKAPRKPLKKSTRRSLIGFSFVAVWIVGFAIFTFYPFIMSIIYSLCDVTIAGEGIEMRWNNFANFVGIFTVKDGFVFLENMLAFGEELLLEVPIILVFSIIIALLLNQGIKCKGIFRAIYFLPVIIASGPVISELISTNAAGSSFIEEYGVMAILQNNLPAWLATPFTTLFKKIIVIFWFSGVQIIIFLSGLQKINSSTYEAAKIDGAGPWECFWKITLPSLKGMFLLNGIYTVVYLSTSSENSCIKLLASNLSGRPIEGVNGTITGYGFASAEAWMYLVLVGLALAIVFVLFKNKKEVR